MELERIIRETLTCFIQSHIPAADLSGMDDVFFSYITGVLEELGSPESSEETFDMDTFVEMMEAYIPGFAEIQSGNVCEMMFSLSERLGEARNKEKPSQKAVESRTEVPSEDLPKGQEPGAGVCKEETLCTPTDGAGAQEGNDLKGGVELLLEMFPACTVSQAEKALAMALGNLEEAVQLIVEEKVEIGAAGASVKLSKHRLCLHQDSSPEELCLAPHFPHELDLVRPRRAPNHEELKQVILQKYMMVDSAEDQKTHRPAPPKEAPKKLIRYIDNQVLPPHRPCVEDGRVALGIKGLPHPTLTGTNLGARTLLSAS
ncbi:CUE domain-containing protein 2 isoform X1 [Gallus gallus]|uniref:CUE domain-containing protein 2 isoform X1 n=1 Tax=Gallus gallus TaxID=9031 RepID=UPI000D63FC70|nr:CUE domain-containing protein 2 isoform X1 [Gallus gallus]XP_040558338.1 CUE domain-containing protein 2 isoform X1 [Gallus gallus]XP_046776158.1 CUE domain-containing protein 2 isoform X1 [Gallus gallus]XP_046776159.1 CUE domain-containing protein 2 isoform X1 [Gallus gallus]XP_046776160.1 CUE domain-containing protein 2 isoform X1 [Gallus gallus]XP_046798833.1 CUE domain-containing protein 2 isoform X1 [Gallus gallus]|eukprot:XP_025007341.1 CUE domain-containing protein 2 isoform X1 [Gallus gallus]